MFKPVLITALVAFLLVSCSSGKNAYQSGNYYQAVMDAVDRLRSSPDNKKAREVLDLSYPLAVDYIETEIKNQMLSMTPNRWQQAVHGYNQINAMYESIRRCPAALQVIPSPQSRFRELADSKQMAAEELYRAGLEFMQHGTRQDYKQAYFRFRDAIEMVPNYRDAVQQADQARFNATLWVVVEPVLLNPTGWNFEPIIFGFRGNDFVRFISQDQAMKEGFKNIDQYLSLAVGGYQQSIPSISRQIEERFDSVKTGERKSGNKTVPVKMLVKAKVTTYEKTIQAVGGLKLVIFDGVSKAQVADYDINSSQVWKEQWATFNGDERALTPEIRALCERYESEPPVQVLRNNVRQDLEHKLAALLTDIYRQF